MAIPDLTTRAAPAHTPIAGPRASDEPLADTRWSFRQLLGFRIVFLIAVASAFNLVWFVERLIVFPDVKRFVSPILDRWDFIDWQIEMVTGGLVHLLTRGETPLGALAQPYNSSGPLSVGLHFGRTGPVIAASYLAWLLIVVIVGAGIWTILDRRRDNYQRLRRWVRVFLRYELCLVMMSYGIAKIVPTQFGFLTPAELLRPFGQTTPHSILWNFMATSTLYTIFTGAVEVLGALLLLNRRTTALGALILFGALSNIVVLNIAFHLRVVSTSLLLLILSVLILGPYLRPLFGVLALGRAAKVPDEPVLYSGRGWRLTAVKTACIGTLMLAWIHSGVVSRRSYSASGHALYGVFDVDSVVRNGQAVSLTQNDTSTWRRVANDGRYDGAGLTVQLSSGDFRKFQLADDTTARIWTLRAFGRDSSVVARLHYKMSADADASLVGTIGTDSVALHLSRVDMHTFGPMRVF